MANIESESMEKINASSYQVLMEGGNELDETRMRGYCQEQHIQKINKYHRTTT